jgi:hypothetical protein
MNEIICPHCKKAFKIDEAGFADILKQVRDKQNAVMLAQANAKNELQAEVAKKDSLLSEIKAQRDTLINELKAEKDSEIATLKAQLESSDIVKKLAVTEAVNRIEKERDSLVNDLRTKDAENT